LLGFPCSSAGDTLILVVIMVNALFILAAVLAIQPIKKKKKNPFGARAKFLGAGWNHSSLEVLAHVRV